MSTVKISELPVLSSANAADEFVVVDDSAGVTKKITQAGLADFGSNTLTAAGITFGSDTLDDYEEGTFSAFTAGSASNASLVSSEKRQYTKVGNLVNITFGVRINFTSTTGFIQLLGLPFSMPETGTLAGTLQIGAGDFARSVSAGAACWVYRPSNTGTETFAISITGRV